MLRQILAALLAGLALAAGAAAQGYDLFIIEDAAFGETIHAVTAPNGRWAGVRAGPEGPELEQGAVAAAAPENASSDLAFVRSGGATDLAHTTEDTRTYVRVGGASAADARSFIDGIAGAPAGVKAGMRAALGL